jgi:hypothetical protein
MKIQWPYSQLLSCIEIHEATAINVEMGCKKKKTLSRRYEIIRHFNVLVTWTAGLVKRARAEGNIQQKRKKIVRKVWNKANLDPKSWTEQ